MFAGSTQNNLGFLATTGRVIDREFESDSATGKDIALAVVNAGSNIAQTLLNRNNGGAVGGLQLVSPGIATTGSASNVGAGVGNALDSAAGGLGLSTSTLLLLAGGAVFLMMMKPPRRG